MMEVDAGKVILALTAKEELKLDGAKPILRAEKGFTLKMKMRSTTKFEVMMEAFCKNIGLKREQLSFWFTDELSPNQTPEQVGMKMNDVISVYSAKSKENPGNSSKIVNIPPSTLTNDFKSLLNKEELCDVYFVVNEVRIPAHKQIVAARCSKFRAMFQSFRESKQSEIKIDCYDPKLFLSLLEYIYSDSVEISSADMAVQLMILADEYLLPRLKEICETEIIKAIDVSNVAELMETAHRYHSKLLKNFCLEFILQNYEFTNGNGFRSSLQSPELLHEILEAMSKNLPEKRKRSSSGGSDDYHNKYFKSDLL